MGLFHSYNQRKTTSRSLASHSFGIVKKHLTKFVNPIQALSRSTVNALHYNALQQNLCVFSSNPNWHNPCIKWVSNLI